MRPPTKAARSAAEARVRRAYGVAPPDFERAARDAERARSSWPPLVDRVADDIDVIFDGLVCPRLGIGLPGPPKPKGRPRTYVGGDGRPHTKTPADTKAYEAHVRQVAELRVRAHGSWPVGGYPGARYIVQAHYVLAHDAPDADNLAKCLDALNGVAWGDDRDVALLVTSKRFAGPGEHPGANIDIWAIRPEKEADHG